MSRVVGTGGEDRQIGRIVREEGQKAQHAPPAQEQAQEARHEGGRNHLPTTRIVDCGVRIAE